MSFNQQQRNIEQSAMLKHNQNLSAEQHSKTNWKQLRSNLLPATALMYNDKAAQSPILLQVNSTFVVRLLSFEFFEFCTPV